MKTVHFDACVLLLLLLAFLASPRPADADCLDQEGAVLTITGPASTQADCFAAADYLNTNPAYLEHFVSFISPFSCSCSPLGPAAGGPCAATLTATLPHLVLLQYYANIWAAPTGGTYGRGAYAIFINQSNPTCTQTQPCSDVFPGIIRARLGGGEQCVLSIPARTHASRIEIQGFTNQKQWAACKTRCFSSLHVLVLLAGIPGCQGQ
jgi:hypothetical protein